jgi:hypothetical protein
VLTGRDQGARRAVLKAAILIICLACCIVFSPACASTQKTIVIDESLSANSDQMEVKEGPQKLFSSISKFRFGDYAVVSGKRGWETTTGKPTLSLTHTERNSKYKLWFLMKGPTSDTARVNAAHSIEVKSSHSIQILPHIFLGSDEVLEVSDHIVATININEDATDTWTLIMNVVRRPAAEEENRECFLTNGVRKILVVLVTSNKNGDDSGFIPALGYEFQENGQALGAVQFWGGGLFGWDKITIYIHRNLEPKMKLLLAAAMTAVLQVKSMDIGSWLLLRLV